MKVSNSSNCSPKDRENLRNFDLSVEEIKLIKAIKEMAQSLEYIEHKNIQPERQKFFRNEIRILESQLDEIRDNTLIR